MFFTFIPLCWTDLVNTELVDVLREQVDDMRLSCQRLSTISSASSLILRFYLCLMLFLLFCLDDFDFNVEIGARAFSTSSVGFVAQLGFSWACLGCVCFSFGFLGVTSIFWVCLLIVIGFIGFA